MDWPSVSDSKTKKSGCFPSRSASSPICSRVRLSRSDTCAPLAANIPVLSVLHLVHYGVAVAVVLLTSLIKDRKLIKKVDYSLLFTFIFFFIFVGNVKNIPSISVSLSNIVRGREVAAGILLSQAVSNVPAAMLLSGFTTNYASLLLGVNIGGLGTLIASMASVISYKIYCSFPQAESGRYLRAFTAYNAIFLAILWMVTEIVWPSLIT